MKRGLVQWIDIDACCCRPPVRDVAVQQPRCPSDGHHRLRRPAEAIHGPGRGIDRRLRDRARGPRAAARVPPGRPRRLLELVRASAAELQALIEPSSYPRPGSFAIPRPSRRSLASCSTTGIRARGPTASSRVLSLPCSTGEEPYSMAMALLDAGVPAQTFHIHAVDISERALAHWRAAACTGRFRFADSDLEYRDRYFERTATGYRMCDSVRDQVDFRHGNLLSPAILPGAETYDVSVLPQRPDLFRSRGPGTRDCRADRPSGARRAAVCRTGRGRGALESWPRVGPDAEGSRLSQSREGRRHSRPATRLPAIAAAPRRAVPPQRAETSSAIAGSIVGPS